MQSRVIFAGAALCVVLTGCQSSPLKTAANSKFGIGGLSRFVRRSNDDDAQASATESQDKASGLTGDAGNQPDGGSTIKGHLQRGHVAEGEDRWTEARMHYQRVIEIEPDNPLAHHRLAIIADKHGDYRTSEEHYLTALRANRDDPNLLSDFGYSFLLQNKNEECEYYLRQALRADSSHLRALNNLGLLNARKGDYDGALAMFRLTGPDREVQAKMRELFPNGRPRGDGIPARGANSFAQSREPSNDFAPSGLRQDQSQSRPAARTVDRNSWPRPNTNQSIPAARSPMAPSPRGDIYPAGSSGFASQSAGNPHDFAPNSSVRNAGRDPFGTAGNRTTDNSIPGSPGQSRNIFGSGGSVPSPTNFDSSGNAPLKQRSRSIDPLDTLQEWPAGTGVETMGPGRNTAATPAGSGRRSGDPFATSSQTLGGPRPHTPTQGASPFTSPGSPIGAAVPHASRAARQSAAMTPADARRRAAMLGLNSGSEGIFPALPEVNNDLSQARPGSNSRFGQPVDQSRQANPAPMPGVQGAMFPTGSREPYRGVTPPFGTPEQRGTVRGTESQSAADFNTNSYYRTAARPLSQPEPVRNANTGFPRDTAGSFNRYRSGVQQNQMQPGPRIQPSPSGYRQPGGDPSYRDTNRQQFNGFDRSWNENRAASSVPGQRQRNQYVPDPQIGPAGRYDDQRPSGR